MNRAIINAATLSRVRGAWFGVFVGDAIGTTLEFQPKLSRRQAEARWHDDITGGGPFDLEPGDWTDDGAMTLCLANALSWETPPIMDVGRQLEYYLRWQDEGWCSSNGRCFDIGNQTDQALAHFDATASPTAPETPQGQGNGALMRAVPVPIWLLRWAETAPDDMAAPEAGLDVAVPWREQLANLFSSSVKQDGRFQARAASCARVCAATHNSPVCVIAAVIYSELVYHALLGSSRQQLLDLGVKLVSEAQPHFPEFGLVLRALTSQLAWEQLEPTGWVIHSLSVACWALATCDSFAKGMTEVVNLRGDADTNGAIYGGLAGAHFGIDTIPGKWRARLKHREPLTDALEALLGMRPVVDPIRFHLA